LGSITPLTRKSTRPFVGIARVPQVTSAIKQQQQKYDCMCKYMLAYM